MILSQEQIQNIVREYFKDKPVKKVYLFGSYARGEADENSDVDLLVDLDSQKRLGWSGVPLTGEMHLQKEWAAKQMLFLTLCNHNIPVTGVL